MSVIEKSGLLKYKDKSGNLYLMLPITSVDNVDGLEELVETAKILANSVPATSTDGIAYSATVSGITALTAGQSFIMVPNKQSTSKSTTLNVNGLGAKNLRVRVSGYTATTSSPVTTNWMAAGKPVRVTYDGMWWVAEIVIPSAQQLYGSVPAEDVSYSNTNSGMTATQVQAAIDELANGNLRTQVLTTEEYNAVESKDENVLYIISDDTTEADIQTHMADTVKHITAEERTAWNTHTTDTAKHITAEERTAWNALSSRIPDVTTDDDGKVLCVVNGAWVAAAIGSVASTKKLMITAINNSRYTNNEVSNWKLCYVVLNGTVYTTGTIDIPTSGVLIHVATHESSYVPSVSLGCDASIIGELTLIKSEKMYKEYLFTPKAGAKITFTTDNAGGTAAYSHAVIDLWT